MSHGTRIDESAKLRHLTTHVIELRLVCAVTHLITGLFCKRALYKRPYFAKETYQYVTAHTSLMSSVCAVTYL